ncbi:MAG: hypothetical protein GXY03_10445 [Solirubrobacterales bacterium]|mgnify:CR=1 FL=1|nr:hypothetical protein [Solirubrobacterales bacterium]
MHFRLLPALLTALCALAVTFPGAAAAADPPATGPPATTGKLVLDWGKFERANRPAARFLRRSGGVRAVVEAVNRRLSLPEDLSVLFSDQLDVGPAYFPVRLVDGRRTKLIHMPGSFLTDTARTMRRQLRGIHPRWKAKRRNRAAKRLMASATEFVLAHEIGHLLVDQLEIPVTGREEDAVDGFATYLLANDPDFGPRSALAAALQFVGMAQDGGRPRIEDYADEHSVTMQRAYQFMCWVYGSDRKRYRGLVGRDGLPRSRAARCAAEWRQLNSSWSRLLAPHEVVPAA